MTPYPWRPSPTPAEKAGWDDPILQVPDARDWISPSACMGFGCRERILSQLAWNS
jgi:hypothetical protein